MLLDEFRGQHSERTKGARNVLFCGSPLAAMLHFPRECWLHCSTLFIIAQVYFGCTYIEVRTSGGSSFITNDEYIKFGTKLVSLSLAV